MPASKASNAISTTNNRSPSRRGSKPQVEKKRRARINKSLAELQDLIVDTDRTKSGSRIEKADILEMTVRHLRSIRGKGHPPATPESHSQPQADSSSEKSVIEWNQCSIRRFNNGYLQCISDISSYLMQFDKLDWNVHNGLKSHLMDRLRDFNGQSTQVDVVSPRVDMESSDHALLDSDSSNSNCSSTLSPDQSYVGFTPESSNTVVEVIAGRLANGQLAFLLPHNSHDSFPKWDGHNYISTAECCGPIAPMCCGSSAVADNGSCVSQRLFRSSTADLTTVRPDYDSMWRPW